MLSNVKSFPADMLISGTHSRRTCSFPAPNPGGHAHFRHPIPVDMLIFRAQADGACPVPGSNSGHARRTGMATWDMSSPERQRWTCSFFAPGCKGHVQFWI